MELVVDANILIAAFLRSALTRELLLDERLLLWAPEYGLTEAEKVLVSPRLARRLGGLTRDEVHFALSQLTSRIQTLPVSSYRHRLPDARQIAPHPEDAPYLALALHLRLPLWSNDSGVRNQPLIQVYTTLELLVALRGR